MLKRGAEQRRVGKSTGDKQRGFTLIELMIVVGILGVLAAIALPTFTIYVRRARSAEAKEAVKQLFVRTTTYYTPETAARGMSGAQLVGCTVDSTHNAITPGVTKQQGDYSAAPWIALGFQHNPSYYRYEVESLRGAGCRNPRSTHLYYLRARGDLDGDAAQSLFELSVGSNAENELYHGPAFYIVDEAE